MFVLRLAAILIVVLGILSFQPRPSRSAISSAISSRAEFSVEEALLDFPPGATVLFSVDAANAKENLQIDDVFLKRIDAADQTVWTVPVQRPTQTEIGFVVPQLPRGAYEAWCEPKNAGVKIPSIKFTIVPHFLAEDGIIRSLPGKEVEVRVRIPIPKVSVKGGGATEVNVSARLISRNPDIVQVVTDTPQQLDRDGAAEWKVRILKPGIAEVEAAAEGFEPAVMNVVGMPGPGATFLDAQLAVLRTQMRMEQESAAAAQERSRDLHARIEETQRSTGAAASVEKRKQIEKLESRQQTAAAAAVDAERSSTEARTLLERFSAMEPPRLNENDLKPGDVLLVLGSSPIISDAIRRFDGLQLNASAEYSHASLYVGRINEKPMVAEMWSSGYWITSLGLSTADTRLVDVYRYDGIDNFKRDEIANRGKNVRGLPQSFIRSKSPGWFSSTSALPYAFEEISVLSIAALGFPGGPILQTYVATKVDPSAGGRRKMICSELVAWVYEDAGLPLEVRYWKALNDAGIFNSNERRRDYTTPNMIALSRNLRRVGRLIGP